MKDGNLNVSQLPVLVGLFDGVSDRTRTGNLWGHNPVL